uniref:Uncharacterized protein n=1 Tax=Arundo donax TaxID=35708 RepID=A0A0A9FDQ7_ARUDO
MQQVTQLNTSDLLALKSHYSQLGYS